MRRRIAGAFVYLEFAIHTMTAIELILISIFDTFISFIAFHLVALFWGRSAGTLISATLFVVPPILLVLSGPPVRTCPR